MRPPYASLLLCAVLCGCNQAPRTTQAMSVLPPQATVAGRVVLPANSPKLQRIRVEAVRAAEFPIDEVVVPGTVEANPHRFSRVAMPVAGRVRQVYVQLGDAVKEGQELFSVDSLEAGAAIGAWRQGQAQMRTAKSLLAKTEADLGRVRELHEHRAAALKDVLAAQNDHTQAQAALEQAQAATDEARHRLELLGLNADAPSQNVVVRSPISGKVLDIAVVPGEFRNDTSAALMTVADLSIVWISAGVPEALIRHVHQGEAVEVMLSAYPGEKFRARVARIADVVDAQTRTVKVQAEIPNPSGRLRPEMFGEIRHTHAVKRLPALPPGAILQLEARNVALVEEQAGVFHETEVRTGAPSGGLVPVLAGLREGDRVVVDGAMLLRK